MQMYPSEFWLKLRGYRDRREEDFRSDAELTRMQTTELINIQLEPGKRFKPHQLWKFPWDDEDEDEQFASPEENEKNLIALIESLPK